MKALEILKHLTTFCGVGLHNDYVEAIAELEALSLQITELKMMEEDAQQYALKCRKDLEALRTKSCDGRKYGIFRANSRGIEVECTLIWHCARGNDCPDRYEPKEQ